MLYTAHKSGGVAESQEEPEESEGTAESQEEPEESQGGAGKSRRRSRRSRSDIEEEYCCP